MDSGNHACNGSGNNAHDSEQYLREIMDGLSPSVFVGLLTVDGTLTYANRAALDTIGMRPEDILGKPFDAGFWWGASETSRQHVRLAIEAAAKGVESRFDIVVRSRSGRLLTMDFTLHPVFGDEGRVICLVPSAYDVTERKQVEQALRFTQFAVDHAQDSLLRIGLDGRVRYANEAACRLLGYAQETLLGMRIHQIDAELSEADWTARWQILKSRGSLRCESMYRHSDGRPIPVETSMSYLEYEGDEYSFFYVTDISERKAAQERIDYLAHHDGLTGLPNRVLAHERLSKTIDFAGSHQMHVTVLFIGLDRFKLVNAALGHAGGDEVLRIVAKRMTAAVREIDTVARIGGDEFVVLLVGDASRQDCPSKSAQVVLDAFVQPIMVGGHELFVTSSIGAAVFPNHGSDAEELLKNAYAAMHRAKELGRNTLKVYSQESGDQDQDPERLPLEAALRKVLGGDEFRVYFQPQVELSTGKIRGAEALLRWQRPESGMLSPIHFIPIAEETGLILPIGEWILHAACVQCKNWQEQGLALERISVNLSARQFRQKDLSLNVARLLDKTGINPEQLEIELTESMLMQDIELAIRSMYQLKDLGIRIALDDFGTGYSSLSYLKRFPIDTLKIDQSFVREITTDQNSAAIADAIIAMAHSLKLTVIAEGVETEAQLAMLRERGCDEVQGYLVCKPLPADEMTRVLREAPIRQVPPATLEASGILPAFK
jgi:diguanylate cyclase (GGDEF)-like protein/PAS domain S-box-containing protein